MPFVSEQLPVLGVWTLALSAAAMLIGLLILLLATRAAREGSGALVRFMAANAFWSTGIAVVMIPMAALPRSLVFHWVWLGAALTAALWIRAVLQFTRSDHRPLLVISNGLLALAAFILVDSVLTVAGFSVMTELKPMEQPGLMIRAAGNQVSFGPTAAVIGGVWGLAVLVASFFLARLVRREVPAERLLLIGVVLTGVVSVLDGVTATLENAVALSFAANLVEAMVLTSAQIRRVAARLAEVERASREQQVRLAHQLEQLRDLQKLSMLGAQTARISHDLRNPLTAILFGVDQLKDALVKAGHSEKEVKELTRFTERAIDQTLDLASGMTRTFRQTDKPERFDVGGCIDDALLLCSRSMKGIDVSVDRVAAEVVGQSSELTQVLVNLLQNATEALVDTSERWVRVQVAVSEGQVVIDVADAGHRPPEHVTARMFRAPFTTKGEGGTGLGLEICRHVVEGMGGTIAVDLETPFTTIRIQLPRARGDSARETRLAAG